MMPSMLPPSKYENMEKRKALSDKEPHLRRVREEFAKFEQTMEELHYLRQIAQDLKSFREMIQVKKYD
jgi:hypothetical protein